MDRIKMSRRNRAKQFTPFDALKGLKEALRLKEYEHDRNIKGDIPPEKIEEISKCLLNLKKWDVVEVCYFCDGYNKNVIGKSIVDYYNHQITVGDTRIMFDDILEIKRLYEGNSSNN